jgi:predicted nucleic acid-binding protein
LIYVLDASAILRYLDDGPGADRVENCINSHIALHDQIVVSAIQWGEVASVLVRRHGPSATEDALNDLRSLDFNLIPATAERAQRAAFIKQRTNLPYADAFAVELASDSPNHVLLTADFDFKLAKREIKIEFLPQKSDA